MTSGGARARGLDLQRHTNTYLPLAAFRIAGPFLQREEERWSPLASNISLDHPSFYAFASNTCIPSIILLLMEGNSLVSAFCPGKSGIAGENVECREMSVA